MQKLKVNASFCIEFQKDLQQGVEICIMFVSSVDICYVEIDMCVYFEHESFSEIRSRSVMVLDIVGWVTGWPGRCIAGLEDQA